MTYELEIQGGVALGVQEPVSRLLCPVPEHDGPCEVPWGFSRSADGDLLLGIYATADQAAEVASAVRQLTGCEVVLSESGQFDELVEQYRIEHPGN